MTDPASPAARDVETLWWLMLGVSGVTFAVFAVLLVVGLARGRPDTRPVDAEPRSWLWGGGVILPAIAVGGVLVATLVTMNAIESDEPPTRVVEVVGHQWWWEVRHLDDDGDVVATEVDVVHLPVDEIVELRMTSADVIHSFWIPALGRKMDLLPERVNRLTLRADAVGRYPGHCAEFCGLGHTHMGLEVLVAEPDEHDAWLAERSAVVDGAGGS